MIRIQVETMDEEVKRLQPTQNVLRELFVRSGNICAFPECSHPIVNADGTYIANLCHIEAALEGGPRFNPMQTNEDRREAANLMLMCHRHHKETDDVEKFSVSKLRRLKVDHEAKFDRILDNIANDIYDLSEVAIPSLPSSIGKTAAKHFDYDAPEELLKEIAALASGLQRLSPISRKIFKIIVKRADGEPQCVKVIELENIIMMSSQDLYSHIVLLADAGLVWDDEDSVYYERSIVVRATPSGANIPAALACRDFCLGENLNLEAMLVDLDFLAIES